MSKDHFLITISDAFGARHFAIKRTTRRNLIIAGVLLIALTVGSVNHNFRQAGHGEFLQTQNDWLHIHNAGLGEKLTYHTRQVHTLNRELGEIERLAGMSVSAAGDGELTRRLTGYGGGPGGEFGAGNGNSGRADGNGNLGTGTGTDNVAAGNRNLGAGTDTDNLATGNPNPNPNPNRTALAPRIRAVAEFYQRKESEYGEIDARLSHMESMVAAVTNPHDDALRAKQNLAARTDLAALSVQQQTLLHNAIPNGFPVKTRIITSKFGNRIHPITGVKAHHNGADIRAKKEQVRTTADGIVRSVGSTKAFGKRIIVRHNFGFESHYAHLSEMSVKPGDIVHRGDVIGVSGNSGRSSGPHLHYEIRYLGGAVDPIDFMNWEFGSHEIFTSVKGVQWQSLINLINKQITHPTLRLSQVERSSPANSK